MKSKLIFIAMILFKLKLAIRNLLKNKSLNGINIFGLTIGIMAALLISQYIKFENSYDKFYENADQIHRLVFYRYYSTGLDKSVGNNYVAGQLAKDNIPEVENFFRCKKSTEFIEVGDEIFKEERAFYADSSFFDILSNSFLSGNNNDLLNEPNVVVITESTAHKYFGKENPIGKTIYRINPGKTPMTVQAVVKDVPENSHLKYDMVISFASQIGSSYCYTCNNTNTYFLLKKGSNPEIISKKITDVALQYLASKKLDLDFKIEYHLQNIKDIHLHSNYRFEHEANGNYKYQLALLIIALFILISAWLNFSNIYKSLLENKIGNLGLRKINGASWKSLSAGIISDIMFTSLISLFLAYCFLFLVFPFVKNYLNLEFSLNMVNTPGTVISSILIIVGISILVGLLTSVKILRHTPIQMIQTKKLGYSNKKTKKLLLITQFSIAIFLLTGTFVVLKQINFMQEQALTMDIDQVLVVKRPTDRKFNSAQNVFQASIEKMPEITGYTYSTITPGEKNSWVKGGISIKGLDKNSDQIYQASVSPGFFDFFGIKMIAGQQFFKDETNWNGGKKRVVINKEAAFALGSSDFDDLIGKTLYDTDNSADVGEIIGVVDGYFQNSLDQKVLPTIFNPDQFGYFLFLKIRKGNLSGIIPTIKTEFQKNFENSYFEYFFLDDYFNKQYQMHIRFNRSFVLFSVIAVIIASLSLLSIVMMASSARIKEIGIRKVNGARIREILFLLNKDFVLGVIIAIVVTTPVTWFLMNRWLENFAYKTTLSWWIFALAALLALGIALLTVSWQSWKAATRNPVEALRYE